MDPAHSDDDALLSAAWEDFCDQLKTIYWMRSDKPFDAAAFERLLTPEAIAFGLNRVIDQIERAEIPRERIHDFQFADMVKDTLPAVADIYRRMDLEYSSAARHGIAEYLAHKPPGKFGTHSYYGGEREQIARERPCFARYQAYFGVPDEE